MSRRALMLCLPLSVLLVAGSTGADKPETLVSWLTGSFSSARQASADSFYSDIRLEVVQIWPERGDGYWLYVEQAAAGHLNEPYRQRVYRITVLEDESFRSGVYLTPDPLRFAGDWAREAPLGILSADSLQLRDGCAVMLRQDSQGHFVGGTIGDDCRSSLHGATYATSEVRIGPDRVESWDRGFSESGEQVWGAEKGPYVFLRQRGPRTIVIDLPGLEEGVRRLEMVLIEPGSFIMGAPKDELGRSGRDWLPHEVSITRPFYIGKYEMTQAQWEAVTGSGSHHSKFRGRPNNPVEKVSWLACQKFIRRLNALGMGTFRLPTEAEWEYACRAGTQTRFSFGDALERADKPKEYCEIADEYMWWSGNVDPYGTKEVGSKMPNPWGFHDMHGNVSEWCSDLWEAPRERGPQVDPQGPSSWWFSKIWPLANRVNRGGGIYRGARFRGASECRSASRHYEQAIDFHYSLGFRLVREFP